MTIIFSNSEPTSKSYGRPFIKIQSYSELLKSYFWVRSQEISLSLKERAFQAENDQKFAASRTLPSLREKSDRKKSKEIVSNCLSNLYRYININKR